MPRLKGLIGDVITLSIGREHSVREMTVEVRDGDHADRMAESIGKVSGCVFSGIRTGR